MMAIDLTVSDRERRLAGEQVIADAETLKDRIVRRSQYGG